MTKSDQELVIELQSQLEEKNTQLAEQNTQLAEKDKQIALLSKTSIVKLDSVLDNEEQLGITTGKTKSQYQFIVKRAEKKVKKSKNRPLFSEDRKDPGNRCKCHLRHVVFFALLYAKHHPTQQLLAIMGDVDQSTISRYLDFIMPIISDILPTPDKIAKEIRDAKTIKQLEKLIPQRQEFLDGTYVRVQRPQKNQQDYYSGKRKTHTYNTTIGANADNLINYTGKSCEGKRHDFAMLKEDLPKLGKWIIAMKDPNTKSDSQMIVYTDSGYQGIGNLFPGAKHKQPRKKSKLQPLTITDKERNQKISKKRVKIEHAICRLKQYRILSDVYTGTQEEFDADLKLVAGLVNFHIMWKSKKYRHLLEKIC